MCNATKCCEINLAVRKHLGHLGGLLVQIYHCLFDGFSGGGGQGFVFSQLVLSKYGVPKLWTENS